MEDDNVWTADSNLVVSLRGGLSAGRTVLPVS